MYPRLLWMVGSRVDCLGALNDLRIARTAWRIRAAVVTGNHDELALIAAELPGLEVLVP